MAKSCSFMAYDGTTEVYRLQQHMRWWRCKKQNRGGDEYICDNDDEEEQEEEETVDEEENLDPPQDPNKCRKVLFSFHNCKSNKAKKKDKKVPKKKPKPKKVFARPTCPKCDHCEPSFDKFALTLGADICRLTYTFAKYVMDILKSVYYMVNCTYPYMRYCCLFQEMVEASVDILHDAFNITKYICWYISTDSNKKRKQKNYRCAS